MEFKVGDKVVCVDLDCVEYSPHAEANAMKHLVLNKYYTISELHYYNNHLTFALDEIDKYYGYTYVYSLHRFKLLSVIRKEKLKNIKNGI